MTMTTRRDFIRTGSSWTAAAAIFTPALADPEYEGKLEGIGDPELARDRPGGGRMKRLGRAGLRIWTLTELRYLQRLRRAVVCPESHSFRGPLPAAFMMNLSGSILARLFETGMYHYVIPLAKPEAA